MANIEDIYPLSSMQELLLVYSMGTLETGASFEQLTFELDGEVDRVAFEKAWQHLIERHTSLRTGYVWEDLPSPLQLVQKNVTLPFVTLDWSDVSAEDLPAKLDAFYEEDRSEGFNLMTAPLMRITLIQVADGKHLMVWSFHHLLADGWSLSILTAEFLKSYDAFCKGSVPALATCRPYRDYVAWLKAQDMGQVESFWRTALRGFKEPTSLQAAWGVQARVVQSEALKETRYYLATETTQALEKLAREQKVTVSTLIQAIWSLVLGGATGKQDVLFGATVSGRPVSLDHSESIIGLFINNLPIRATYQLDSTVLDVLNKLKNYHTELQDCLHSPLAQVHQWSEVPLGRALFESLFVFQNYPYEGAEAERYGGVHFTKYAATNGPTIRTNYPLTVIGSKSDTELYMRFVFDQRLFATESIEQVKENFGLLVEAIAHDASQRVGDLLQRCEFSALQPEGVTAQTAISETEYLAPRTPVEEVLAGIWSELLGMEQVGVTTSFFTQGGHSLIVMQLIDRIRTVFQVQLPVRVVFEKPTIEQLAMALLEIQLQKINDQEAEQLVQQA